MCKKALGVVHAAPKQLENFHSENAPNLFRPYHSGEIKIATINVHFAFVIEGNSGRKLQDYFKMFSFQTKNEKPAF